MHRYGVRAIEDRADAKARLMADSHHDHDHEFEEVRSPSPVKKMAACDLWQNTCLYLMLYPSLLCDDNQASSSVSSTTEDDKVKRVVEKLHYAVECSICLESYKDARMLNCPGKHVVCR